MDLAQEVAHEESRLQFEQWALHALTSPFWVRRKIIRELRNQITFRQGALQAARKILAAQSPPAPPES